jgi:hypothetical protein
MAYTPQDSRIEGLALSAAADGKTITLSAGFAYLPNKIQMLLQDPMTIVVNAVSGWRHFYLGTDGEGTLSFEAASVIPADPYQGTARTKSTDVTRRYLASLYFGADGKTIPFLHSQPGNRANRIDFLPPGGAAIAAASLLNVGVATTAVQVSAQAMVPMTCRIMTCLIKNSGSLSSAFLTSGDSAASQTNYQIEVLPGQSGQYQVLMNGSQQLSYVMASNALNTGGLTIKVQSYIFDR